MTRHHETAGTQVSPIDQLADEVGNFDEMFDELTAAGEYFASSIPAPTAGYLNRAFTRRWKRELRCFVKDLVRDHLVSETPKTGERSEVPREKFNRIEQLVYAVIERIVEEQMSIYELVAEMCNDAYSTLPPLCELFREDVYAEWRQHVYTQVAVRVTEWITEWDPERCPKHCDELVQTSHQMVLAVVDEMVAESVAEVTL